MLRGIVLAAAIAWACGAAAQPIDPERAVTISLAERVRVETWLGYMRIWATESVYTPSGRKLSELEWRTGDASAVGTKISLAASGRIGVEVSGWAALGSDNVMDDYDWLYPGLDWSHWSHHPDTALERAFQADARIAAAVLDRPDLRLSLLAGYRVLNTKWQADNGSFVYSYNGFRDISGAFEGAGIEYQQWWRTPYLGLGAAYVRPRFSLTGELIGSPLARGSDRDIHFMRDLMFVDTFEPATMFGASLGAERRFENGWILSGAAEWQRYDEARGDTFVTHMPSGEGAVFRDGAGGDLESVLLRIGLARRF